MTCLSLKNKVNKMLRLFCVFLVSFLNLNLYAKSLKETCLIEHKLGLNEKQRRARCDFRVFNVPDRTLNNLSNKYSEFVGVKGMISAQFDQPHDGYGSLKKFRTWAESNDWVQFGPTNHFDWWMFPISDESSQGYKYTVLGNEVKELKNNKTFMANYREGISLMFKSWCWDINNSKKIDNCSQQQRWRNYTVRLRKAIQSMILFEEVELLNGALAASKSFGVELPLTFQFPEK